MWNSKGDYSAKGDARMVVPLEQRFWDDLLSSSAKWGLKVYEQDWLCTFKEAARMHATRLQAGLIGRYPCRM